MDNESSCHIPASGAAILLTKGLSNLVCISVVRARAGFAGAADLAGALTGASVAFFGDRLPNGQSHSAIFAVAGDRVVRAGQLVWKKV